MASLSPCGSDLGTGLCVAADLRSGSPSRSGIAKPRRNFRRLHRPLALALRLGHLDRARAAGDHQPAQHLPRRALPRRPAATAAASPARPPSRTRRPETATGRGSAGPPRRRAASSRSAPRPCRSWRHRSRPPRAAARPPGRQARPAPCTISRAPIADSRSCRSAVVSSAPIGVASRSSTGPVSSPASICMMQTPVSASPARIARWIGAAPRQRGSRRGMDVQAAKPRRIQHRLRQDQPIGHHHRHIGAQRGKLRLRLGAAQRNRVPHRQAQRLGRAPAPGCGRSALPRPAGRGGWQ